MTPERQRWWDNLSTNERELRVALDTNRRMLRLAKKYLTEFKGSVCHAGAVRKQKLIIKALKHELDRSKVAKVKKSAAGEFYCDNCCQFVQRYDNYCAVCGRKLRWCGRKIVEGK